MDIKVLLGILGRPWFMEPTHASVWGEAVAKFLANGTMPTFDKRGAFMGFADFGPVFRLNPDGSINNVSGPIQVLRLDAPILKYDYCGSPGTQTLSQLLAAANADPAISSILLWIDSPGGQCDGTEQFANAVRESKKPVVAFCDGVMASASYWIGSSAREVISDGANDGWNATIGSIGTMCTYMDDSEKLEKEGIRRVRIFADDSHEKWGDYFAVLKGDLTRVKAELKGLNDTFHAAVKTNRAGKLKLDMENVLTGKTYNANEALKYGLIDKIAPFTYAVERAAKLGQEFSKQQKPTSMSTPNNVFQTALKTASAESFQVVDGGFLVSEEQMTAIDQQLAQDATLRASTTAALQTAEGAQAALEMTQEHLATATERATTAEAALTAANTRIAELEAQVKDAGKGIGQFLGNGAQGAATSQDPPPAHGEAKVDHNKFAHNQARDKFFRKR